MPEKITITISEETANALPDLLGTTDLADGIAKHLASLVTNAGGPKKSAKAQHRFQQAFADVPFFIDYNGAKATVTWRKRDEMVIAAGATLQSDMPLNKDGSVGFAQRFALTLREEHADAISNGHTTKDVVLKSANEVGHFLYFAGTNTWLQLIDDQGRTLDELSRA
ncbi:hypothetical protein C6P08_00095 [Weissella confusa]|uniref:Uncharacterized protein n=1 Tax=Weissella confusa TaxID=1583 RepID=A0AAJ2YXE2_WEICO|nr:hypothetical protein [Weissella confusa]MBJ7693577.1 hypothetical protein [Weissella confusa]NBA10841.1 hypothetical protein [Weissella confusa]QBZ03678.1 hypothetical protein C6P08_00095 [Weissella confusa]